MTYCLVLKLDEGLVCLSDTRTNAGLDDISRYRKMFTWTGDDRAVALMSAGNLSITQGVVDRLDQAVKAAERGEAYQDDLGVDEGETVLSVPTLFRLAQIIGLKMRALTNRHREPIEREGAAAGASIILAGQTRGAEPRAFLIYSAGNFIECSADTPYFQIGETKYGKPIIDRTIRPETALADGVKTALVSMDSTIRSNLSVGLPLDLAVLPTDALRFRTLRRIEEGDPVYSAIADGWSGALGAALSALPDVGEWMA
ncbi:MAG: peptidase [Pseudomonadota bacterium]